MKIAAIIAEYNPFHNGHAYQIQKIREFTGADYVIIAMSGDFVQRGAPAVVDKYARAKMALLGGADAVFELPALWATASAEYFATAGVTLFERMGCVDTLCFGVETDNPALLEGAARVLAEEPDDYRRALAARLKEGASFPAAREAALAAALGTENGLSIKGNSLVADELSAADNLSALLALPNNILALEYEKALIKLSSHIKPCAIRREGAGYHDCGFTDGAGISPASATAIRNLLAASGGVTALKDAMPPEALAALTRYLAKTPATSADDFSAQLGYLLLSKSAEELAEYADCNEKIANRLKKNAPRFSSFTSFCEQTKSRDVTYTRMSRIFTHLLLDVRKSDYDAAKAVGVVPYLRLLGFKKTSEELFSEIRRHAQIPILSKLSSAERLFDEPALAILRKDIFASELYCQTAALKGGALPQSEYAREIVIV